MTTHMAVVVRSFICDCTGSMKICMLELGHIHMSSEIKLIILAPALGLRLSTFPTSPFGILCTCSKQSREIYKRLILKLILKQHNYIVLYIC